MNKPHCTKIQTILILLLTVMDWEIDRYIIAQLVEQRNSNHALFDNSMSIQLENIKRMFLRCGAILDWTFGDLWGSVKFGK